MPKLCWYQSNLFVFFILCQRSCEKSPETMKRTTFLFWVKPTILCQLQTMLIHPCHLCMYQHNSHMKSNALLTLIKSIASLYSEMPIPLWLEGNTDVLVADLIYIFNLQAIGYSCSSLPRGTHYNTDSTHKAM